MECFRVTWTQNSSDVRWLSKGKVLDRFFSLLPHFLKEKRQNFPELSSATWLLDVAFLSDITGHLNQLNLKLQGSHFVNELYICEEIELIPFIISSK